MMEELQKERNENLDGGDHREHAHREVNGSNTGGTVGASRQNFCVGGSVDLNHPSQQAHGE